MAHMLRTRMDDHDEWSQPQAFASKRERDKAAAMARIWGGIRTHSWTETKQEQHDRLQRATPTPEPTP